MLLTTHFNLASYHHNMSFSRLGKQLAHALILFAMTHLTSGVVPLHSKFVFDNGVIHLAEKPELRLNVTWSDFLNPARETHYECMFVLAPRGHSAHDFVLYDSIIKLARVH